MVFLAPRFLLLAALCAAAMPSLVLVTDARAVEIGARHHYESTSVSHPTPTLAKGKGKDKEVLTPEHHHDHDRDRRDGEAQAAFSMDHDRHERDSSNSDLEKRVVSRIYGKQSFKRSNQGRSVPTESWDLLDSPILQVGVFQISGGHRTAARRPAKREPHHHHHHHDYETVINGNNDDVHVHKRRLPSNTGDEGVGIGVDVGINLLPDADMCREHDGRYVECQDIHRSHQQKRSDSVDGTSGVPGTVDIMNIGPIANQRVASLVLSAVSDNSTTNSTANGTYPSFATKGTSDTDSSPFILDASNTTHTQFYLVVSEPAVPANGTLADTLAALNAVASSKSETDNDGIPSTPDIKVTLQVPVFEPAEAAMRAYCATFDPNPPAPAPLFMDACFDELTASSDASDPTVHKSQTFAYDPVTGTIKPVWYAGNSTGTDSSNSTSTSPLNSTSTSTSNSTTDSTVPQMNFKVDNANKDTLLPSPPALPVPGPVANMTQTVGGTASSTPLNGTMSSAPINGTSGPLNVTLVFTPAAPAVHVVESASGVASFEPLGNDDSSEGTQTDDSAASSSGGSNSDADSEVSMSSGSVASAAATNTDSSLAVPTDSSSGDNSDETTESTESAEAGESTSTSVGTTSNATDVMMDASTTSSTDPVVTATATATATSASTPTSTFSSMTVTPSPTLTPAAESDAESAAIEMYQQPVNELC
ncbi:hypothetical protein EW145_g1798 [Phellinidium pouzarii]|uniref:Uncharacterized protein n=1 Tax=Phellinidium pouzarii TaxID=167371 RepID=A0A4S4LF02_9AGAM|nr:hypothetical protein EW145_g1798 [Phellinidium pouzarii]